MIATWRRLATVLGIALLPTWMPLPARAGSWQWPLAGSPDVVRAFTPPRTPYGTGHRGVDLAGRPGATVLAAGAGVVGYAGMLAGRGVVTVLHGGGLRTTYEPVVASVRGGQRVALGQQIGSLAGGHPGCRVAACLHWGLLRGEVYLNPLSLLDLGPVRLLPWSGRPATAGAPPPGPASLLRARASTRRQVPAWAPVPMVAVLGACTLLPFADRRRRGRSVPRRAPVAPALSQDG